MFVIVYYVMSMKKIESWVLMVFTWRVKFGSCHFDLLVDGSKEYIFFSTCVVERLTTKSLQTCDLV